MRLLTAVLVVAATPAFAQAASVQVVASIAGEDTSQTKYNVTVTNTGSTALTGFSARVYVDLSEVFAAGKTATCAERFDPAAFTCTLVQHSGNVYYARLDYGTYSLAAGTGVEYKITLRTSDFSAFWNPSNDYSRAGLGTSNTATTLIPVYQGTTRIYGSDPGGGSPTATPTPAPTATPTPTSPGPTPTPTPTSAGATPTPTPTSAAATPTPAPTATPGTSGEITPGASGVTASTNDGNVPGNTVDNNLGTRWSANGDGQWIRYDLGGTYTVTFVKIAFYSGDTRATRFDVQVSSDGTSWSNVLSNVSSSGTSTAEETFDFADANARYVRIVGHGNTVNAWNSLTEVSLFGSACGSCPTPTPGATPTPTATPTTPAGTPTPTPTGPAPRPVYTQTFDSLSTGSRWLSSCKWNKHTLVTDSCGVTSKCLRIKQDPFCKEPPLFPLPPVADRPSYPSTPPCQVCSPYYTNTGTDVVQAVQAVTLGDEYSLNYDLYFEPGYDWARGGKLPGLSAKEWDSGCSIEGDGLPTDPGPARWSVRLMWRANGTNELYVYDQNRVPGACGTRSPTPITFTTGRWYAITIYVKLNTTATSTDGIAGLYIDGQVARQETGIRFRAETTSNSRINQIFFSTFYGGNESKRLYCEQNPGTSPYCVNPDPLPGVSWVPDNISYLRFDNMAVYPGLRVRPAAGQ